MDEPKQAVARNAVFEKGSRLPEPCPPQAGCWCSRRERRPYVRLIVLGNEPRHARGLRTSDPGQTTAGDLSPPKTSHLTLTCSCEACSAFTRVAARTLAPSPIRDLLHRRLQPFRHLHDCSGCFRLERFTGWDLHPLESAAFHGAHPELPFELVIRTGGTRSIAVEGGTRRTRH